MTPSLKQAAEAESTKHYETPEGWNAFMLGVQWLWDYLQKSAPELDDGAASYAYDQSYENLQPFYQFLKGAKWWHEQSKAIIESRAKRIIELEAELEERRTSTPTMNALHAMTIERDKWEIACKEAVRRLAK